MRPAQLDYYFHHMYLGIKRHVHAHFHTIIIYTTFIRVPVHTSLVTFYSSPRQLKLQPAAETTQRRFPSSN
mgnify:CR=1